MPLRISNSDLYRGHSSTGMSMVLGRVQRLRALFRQLRAGRGVLPTTVAGAELGIVLAIVGNRIGTIIQILPSVPDGIAVSPRPPMYGLLVLTAVIESIAITVASIRRRHYIGAPWTTFDLALACGFLLLEFMYVPLEHRVGSWVGWASAYALMSVASAAAALPERWQLAVGTGCVTTCFVIATWPVPARQTSNMISSAFTFVIFAILLRVLVSYLRRIARAADENRLLATEAGGRAQLDRTRLLLHDSATILRLVSQGDIGPEVGAMLRQQAATESVRIRNFLTGDQPQLPTDHPSERRLTDVIRDAGSGFGDLPIDYAVDLASEVVLDPATADALGRALGALLHNVRAHAAASAVVVHADTGDGEWEITVRDDGNGFDPETTDPGFGLAIAVERALDVRGVSSLVMSAPEEGTTAVLRGAWAGPG